VARKPLKLTAQVQEVNTFGEVGPRALSAASADPYTVFVANRSNWDIIAYRMGTGAWVHLPRPIGRTCDLECEECFLFPKKYVKLVTVSCITKAFDLHLFVQQAGAEPRPVGPFLITPTCGDDGHPLCLTMPD